jgi:hypothetical protein
MKKPGKVNQILLKNVMRHWNGGKIPAGSCKFTRESDALPKNYIMLWKFINLGLIPSSFPDQTFTSSSSAVC